MYPYTYRQFGLAGHCQETHRDSSVNMASYHYRYRTELTIYDWPSCRLTYWTWVILNEPDLEPITCCLQPLYTNLDHIVVYLQNNCFLVCLLNCIKGINKNNAEWNSHLTQFPAGGGRKCCGPRLNTAQVSRNESVTFGELGHGRSRSHDGKGVCHRLIGNILLLLIRVARRSSTKSATNHCGAKQSTNHSRVK